MEQGKGIYEGGIENAIKRVSEGKEVSEAHVLLKCDVCGINDIMFDLTTYDKSARVDIVKTIDEKVFEVYRNGCEECGNKLKYVGFCQITQGMIITDSEFSETLLIGTKMLKHEKEITVYRFWRSDDGVFNIKEEKAPHILDQARAMKNIINEKRYEQDILPGWWC